MTAGRPASVSVGKEVMTATSPSIVLPGYRIERLPVDSAAQAQALFEACADYTVLERGETPLPHAAETELQSLPPGGSIADKFIFALMKEPATMIGMIVTDRNWPNNSSWWIALMLVAPAERGKGVAFSFAAAVLDWIEGQGPQRIELAVFDENRRGNRFWLSLGFEYVRSTEPRIIGRKKHVLHVLRRDAGLT
jgi:RimJ/RimL family protein N-acetyltransferase